MNKHLLALVAFLALLVSAEQTFQLSEDLKLRLGASARLRWEFFDQSVVLPNDDEAADAVRNQYLRVRARAWAALDYQDDFTVNISLNSRFHKVSNSPANPNDQDAKTWEFPEEVIFDALNIVFHNFLTEGLSMTLGRQNFGLGNGMIIADATPFDQGRTMYMDGLFLKYKNEEMTGHAFVTYNSWKDNMVFLNDKHRRLHCGDVFTAGAYVTSGDKAMSADIYAIFNDIHDNHPREAERNHYRDSEASLLTTGFRLFGQPIDLIDYSLELAGQFDYHHVWHHPLSYDKMAFMGDGRLNFHLPVFEEIKPILGFEYVHFSGDKEREKHSHGWNSVLSKAPLWTEELMPILLNGNWTNLNGFHNTLRFTPYKDISVLFDITDYRLDEQQDMSGKHLGLLFSTSLGYKYSDNLSFAFQYAHFRPGNAYNNGHNSNWGRLEATVSF